MTRVHRFIHRPRSKTGRIIAKALVFTTFSAAALVVLVIFGNVFHAAILFERACEGFALASMQEL